MFDVYGSAHSSFGLWFAVPGFWVFKPALNEFPTALNAVVVQVAARTILTFNTIGIGEYFIRPAALQMGERAITEKAVKILFGVFNTGMTWKEFALRVGEAFEVRRFCGVFWFRHYFSNA
jgi:hypothetical protein